MLTTTDVARIYDTVLSIPGMNDQVKIDLKISRKNVLLLSSVIERGLMVKEDEKSQSLLSNVSKETLQELRDFAGECLQKAGLVELNEKLHGLNAGKG
ncbi:MAG: hypothetical protein ACRDE2_12100 [Chitinophagaceae bacterium]